ncbi:MAG: group II intron reverse transcriptase/maturase [Chitinophagales bacterium]
MRKWYSLYDKVYSNVNLLSAYQKVKANRGASGVDGVRISDFDKKREEELDQLEKELKEKRYIPEPVKRVYIPKSDGSERPLGIPTVGDRVVQQALLNVLQPIFDPGFHPSSYGYRPGRSAAQAVAKAERFSNRWGLNYVVDMDLSKCFDTLDHDLIIAGVREKVRDGSVLSLIRQMLEAGIMDKGKYHATKVGSPQGGVISPLLMNIYLDKFDQYMKGQGIRIVRYADDILIFARTRGEAGKYRQIATEYLEKELLLTVNVRKTHLTTIWDGMAYLGFIITHRGLRIHPKSVKKFKDKIRELTPRNSGRNVELQIKEVSQLLRGFAGYFRIAQVKTLFREIMSWVRRRLRMKQMREWKSWKGLHKQLRRLGYKGSLEKISMTRWRNASCHLIHKALPNEWFNQLGLYNMEKVQTNTLHQYYE